MPLGEKAEESRQSDKMRMNIPATDCRLKWDSLIEKHQIPCYESDGES